MKKTTKTTKTKAVTKPKAMPAAGSRTAGHSRLTPEGREAISKAQKKRHKQRRLAKTTA